MRKYFTIFFLSLTIFAKAQQRPGAGAWYTVNLHVNIYGKWQWHNDAGYRTLGASFQPLQFLYRTGLRFNFNKEWSTAGGVAFFFTKTDFYKSRHAFGNEFRFWQEGLYQPAIHDKLSLQLRVRTEQRFFSTTSRKEKYTGHRFRFRAGINQRLNEKMSLLVADEYMHQFAQDKFSFDQNRVIVTVNYKINQSCQFQTGYMWLKWPDANQHLLIISLTKSISLHENR